MSDPDQYISEDERCEFLLNAAFIDEFKDVIVDVDKPQFALKYRER